MAPMSVWVWVSARVRAVVLARGRVLQERVAVACYAASASHGVVQTAKASEKSAPRRAGVACVLICDGCCDGARDHAEERESVSVRWRRQGL